MDLKSYRELLEITQEQAAKELGIVRQYYERIENGSQRPGPILVLKIESWSHGKVEKTRLRPDLW